MRLADYGYRNNPNSDTEIGEGTGSAIPARITATHRERYEVVCDRGSGSARLKASAYHYNPESTFPTTGDYVLLEWNPSGDSRITETLPRATYFARLDPSSSGHREQAVAANFDYVFILQSLDRNFNLHRLERYLTLAWQSGAEPVVVLTKTDLAPDAAAKLETARETAGRAAVHAVSVQDGTGLDQLRTYLKPGNTLVFLGSSGVGKSTLVNALAGCEVMATAALSDFHGKGRHTTTHRQLIMLPSGAMIIDTPGMREIGMWDVSEGLDQTFTDVEAHLGHCRFADCTHVSEPGCAVRAAIESGALARERWEYYLKLKQEARYAEDTGGYLQEKKQRFKEIAKRNKQRNADLRAGM